jgi:septum formation protein
MKFELPKLILASGSPRRSEILNAVGWEFTKIVADVDETEYPGEDPAEYVKRLAKTKAEAVAVNYPDEFVLGADTTVVVDGNIIGKPVDLDDARRMLRLLSDKTHQVLTGIALSKNGVTSVDLQATSVKFTNLDDHAVDFLVTYGAPLDKAGAYAVQAQAALFIEGIDGDYWNVVGLPVNLVFKMLTERIGGNSGNTEDVVYVQKVD